MDDAATLATSYDLIIIGAGINGAGIARDAAMRGARVLLVDKGDLGGGTTSWSTRLIHGGLRYLEHGEIGLVRESLRERERLLRIAPHLVHPLPLLVPIYDGDARGPWLIRAGMLAYDALSYDKSLPHHQMLSATAALAAVPGLNPTNLEAAARYYDAQVTFPERLAVENALAAVAHGAVVRTYTRATGLIIMAGAVRGVTLEVAGDATPRHVYAPVVINVAGPWVDAVLAGNAGDAAASRLVGGTKGSHLVVGGFAGAPDEALYAAAAADNRPFFIIPWNGQYLIGTTDVRFSGTPDELVASAEEIDYLLAETNRVLPMARLDRRLVHYTYAGVRPLPYVPAGSAGAITRRHVLHDHAEAGVRGLYSVIGGKLTTYRELAEQAVDEVAEQLKLRRSGATAATPLPGAEVLDVAYSSFVARFRALPDLPMLTKQHLLDVYGGRAPEVLTLAATPALRAPIDEFTGAIGAEVVFAVQYELARSLTDILARRTMIGLGPDLGRAAAPRAAAIAAERLGWDDARVATELAAYEAYLQRFAVA